MTNVLSLHVTKGKNSQQLNGEKKEKKREIKNDSEVYLLQSIFNVFLN